MQDDAARASEGPLPLLARAAGGCRQSHAISRTQSLRPSEAAMPRRTHRPAYQIRAEFRRDSRPRPSRRRRFAPRASPRGAAVMGFARKRCHAARTFSPTGAFRGGRVYRRRSIRPEDKRLVVAGAVVSTISDAAYIGRPMPRCLASSVAAGRFRRSTAAGETVSRHCHNADTGLRQMLLCCFGAIDIG